MCFRVLSEYTDRILTGFVSSTSETITDGDADGYANSRSYSNVRAGSRVRLERDG